MTLKNIVTPEVKDQWAIWAAQNVEGTVVIVEGGDILKMSQNYTTENGRRATLKYKNTDKNITTYRPGIYKSLKNALPEFEQRDAKYVILDGHHKKKRRYLTEIEQEKWQPLFVKLKHFQYPAPGGFLFGVDIYKIDSNRLRDQTLR